MGRSTPRWIALAVVVVGALCAVWLFRGRASLSSVARPALGGVGDTAASPLAPVVPTPPPPAIDPVTASQDAARLRLAAMKDALGRAAIARHIVRSPPERRPDESPALFEERTRALAQFDHFTHDAHLPPEAQQAMMRVIADAEDNWKLALQGAGKQQPITPGAELSDPVLASIYASINQEAQANIERTLEPAKAMVFHSYVPSMMPFLRTGAFEAGR